MIQISGNLKLKPIDLNEHDKLFSLINRIYPPAYKHLWKNEDCSFYFNTFFSFNNLKKELEEEDAEYFFVVYNDVYVGIVRIIYGRTYDLFPNKKATYFHRIYLGEEAQGKGVAKQIFNYLEKRAKDNGSKIMWLKAMDTQKQALKFYVKQGFVVSGKSQLDFKPLHDNLRGMLLMHKPL